MRIEQVAIFPGGVGRAQLGTDRQNQVGLGDRGVRRRCAEGAEDAERERVRFSEDALAGGGGHNG